jgi:hypothetical protein
VSLRSICIPAAVEFIGAWCFDGCSALCELAFEPGSRLARIGRRAFKKCSSLRAIRVPAQVEQIPECCFAKCFSLSTLAFEPGSKLNQIDATALAKCSALLSVTIPAGVGSIPPGAFRDCKVLAEVVFDRPSNLRELDVPPGDFGILEVPDSVEVLTGQIQTLPRGRTRLLQFGQESRIMKVQLTSLTWDIQPGWGWGFSSIKVRRTGFARIPEKALKRFREQFE